MKISRSALKRIIAEEFRKNVREDEEERTQIDEPSPEDLPGGDDVDFPPEWEGKSYGYYVEPRLQRSEGPTYPGFPGGLQIPLQFRDKSGKAVDFTEEDVKDYASFWGFEELEEGREERAARKSRMRASLGGGKKLYPRWWDWLNRMIIGDRYDDDEYNNENLKRIVEEELRKMLKEKTVTAPAGTYTDRHKTKCDEMGGEYNAREGACILPSGDKYMFEEKEKQSQ